MVVLISFEKVQRNWNDSPVFTPPPPSRPSPSPLPILPPLPLHLPRSTWHWCLGKTVLKLPAQSVWTYIKSKLGLRYSCFWVCLFSNKSCSVTASANNYLPLRVEGMRYHTAFNAYRRLRSHYLKTNRGARVRDGSTGSALGSLSCMMWHHGSIPPQAVRLRGFFHWSSHRFCPFNSSG